MTAEKMEGYIRRLRQIGEHEIADVMQGILEGLKEDGCKTCAHFDLDADEMPCVICLEMGDKCNWEWEGWAE